MAVTTNENNAAHFLHGRLLHLSLLGQFRALSSSGEVMSRSETIPIWVKTLLCFKKRGLIWDFHQSDQLLGAADTLVEVHCLGKARFV